MNNNERDHRLYQSDEAAYYARQDAIAAAAERQIDEQLRDQEKFTAEMAELGIFPDEDGRYNMADLEAVPGEN